MTVPLLLFVLYREYRHKVKREKQIKKDFKEFNQSKYSEMSGNDFMTTMTDNGLLGEYNLFKNLEYIGEKYILTNLYVPKKKNKTAEIDLIVINRKGIHVFESKNYKGRIRGDEKCDKWIQQISRWNKYNFQNPIKQNMGHILALQEFLPSISPNCFSSVIVFGNNCTFDKMVINSPNVISCRLEELPEQYVLKTYKIQDVLTDEQVQTIYEQCKAISLVSPEVKAKHIEDTVKAKNRFN